MMMYIHMGFFVILMVVGVVIKYIERYIFIFIEKC